MCKLYADGKPEYTMSFGTLLQAELWASKNARVVPSMGTGWDTRYTVAIYGDVEEGSDLLNLSPIKTILE
jgi:hypothetical protein